MQLSSALSVVATTGSQYCEALAKLSKLMPCFDGLAQPDDSHDATNDACVWCRAGGTACIQHSRD